MIKGSVPSLKELLSISKKAYSVNAFFSDSIYYKIIAKHVKWGFFIPAIWAELQRAQNFPMHCPPARVPITRKVSSTHLNLIFFSSIFFCLLDLDSGSLALIHTNMDTHAVSFWLQLCYIPHDNSGSEMTSSYISVSQVQL